MKKIEMRILFGMMCLKQPETSNSFAAYTLGILSKQFQTIAGDLDLVSPVVDSIEIDVAVRMISVMLAWSGSDLLGQLFVKPEPVSIHDYLG
jgi:hypothetical protein